MMPNYDDGLRYSYEFYAHPDIVTTDGRTIEWRWLEAWTWDEYEEVWRAMAALGYGLMEMSRYRSEAMIGWPMPVPQGEIQEDKEETNWRGGRNDLLSMLRAKKIKPADAGKE